MARQNEIRAGEGFLGRPLLIFDDALMVHLVRTNDIRFGFSPFNFCLARGSPVSSSWMACSMTFENCCFHAGMSAVE